MTMPNVYFKIIGPRRCGTNYTEWLLRNNFKNNYTMRHGLWHKHAHPVKAMDQMNINEIDEPDYVKKAFNNHNIFYPMTVKNPYSFYHSFEKDYNDGEFTEYNREAVMDEYVEKIDGMIEFDIIEDNSNFIVYETLLTNLEMTLKGLASYFGIRKYLNDEIVDQNNRMNKQGEPQRNNSFDPTFYTDRRYIDILPEQIIHKINNDVPEYIFQYLGFKKYENS